MAGIVLKGPLNLTGVLNFNPGAGGKLGIESASAEALVEVLPSDPPQCSSAPPVMLPPPPAGPLDPAPTVWIVNSFNKAVTVKGKPIVALGMAMQGTSGAPKWPGMVLPGSATVTINHLPVNVKNDQAVIFPSGGSAAFSAASGQV